MTTELLRLRGAHAPGTVVQVEGTYYRLARGSWAGPGVWAVRGTVVPEPEEVRAAREIEARISELRAVPNDWTHYDAAAVGGSVAFAGIEVELVPNRCPPQSEWVLLGEAHEVYPASRYARRYRAGRYLIVEHGDFDDWRRAILIPPDLVDAYFAAEQAARGIDQAEAEKWLAQYRGCVGTQLYEWVVAGSREGGNQ